MNKNLGGKIYLTFKKHTQY